MMRLTNTSLLVLALALAIAGCSRRAPVAVAPPPPGPMPAAFPAAEGNSDVPVRPPDPPPIPLDSTFSSAPLGSWDTMSVDEINASTEAPLKPVFFAYDSDELSDEAKTILSANADVLRTYPTWVVTIEGHSDERGTAEYNLALGDRRALAARTYLVSLGIAAPRLRTVSYGKEFPFDPGHDEVAWEQNRRAHFMLTAK